MTHSRMSTELEQSSLVTHKIIQEEKKEFVSNNEVSDVQGNISAFHKNIFDIRVLIKFDLDTIPSSPVDRIPSDHTTPDLETSLELEELNPETDKTMQEEKQEFGSNKQDTFSSALEDNIPA